MSAVTTESTEDNKKLYRIQGGPWASAWKISAGVGLLGLVASFALYGSDPKRFAYSYMFAFVFCLTLGLGALFFVLVQHLTSAGWSVTVRRTAEFFMGGLPILALLFIPILLVMGQLFPWLHPPTAEHAGGEPATASEHAEHEAQPHTMTNGREILRITAPEGRDVATMNTVSPELNADERYEAIEHEEQAHLLGVKKPYLNTTFFLIRVAIYFLVWGYVSMRLFGLSTRQDDSKDPSLTVAAQRMAPLSAIVCGLTLTFAGFDWVMSLYPYWYSTIYGVWFFAGGFVAIHALITLVTLGLRSSGYLGKAVNVEHDHDLGKLTFGFLVFWAYISFAQFFLIWYAAIPEETTYYHQRWGDGPWRYVSLALILVKFVVGFFVLLSRNAKRRTPLLALGCAVIVIMHLVEMYWAVMPNYTPRAGMEPGDFLGLHLLDFTCLLGVGGIYLALVFYRMAKNYLIPIGDPRLHRALSFENA